VNEVLNNEVSLAPGLRSTQGRARKGEGVKEAEGILRLRSAQVGTVRRQMIRCINSQYPIAKEKSNVIFDV